MQEKQKVQKVCDSTVKKKSLINSEKIESNLKVTGANLLSIFKEGFFKLISTLAKEGIDGLIYGDKRPNGTKSGLGNISYKDVYGNTITKASSLQNTFKSNTLLNVAEVLVDDPEKADTVIRLLKEEIKEYQFVSVAKFYQYVNQPSNYTDNKYGWKSLETLHKVAVVTNQGVKYGFDFGLEKIVPIE